MVLNFFTTTSSLGFDPSPRPLPSMNKFSPKFSKKSFKKESIMNRKFIPSKKDWSRKIKYISIIGKFLNNSPLFLKRITNIITEILTFL